MARKALPVIQVKPVPTGSAEYEARREELMRDVFKEVPKEYYLPEDIFNNPPQSVMTVPRTSGILTAQELEITESYDATALSEAIAARKHSAVEVVVAFAKRAIIAHQLTCCLTEWCLAEAIETAAYLDNYLAKTGRTLGPLHGIPVSIKGHIPMAGHYSNHGHLASVLQDKEDSHMVAILRNAGAVFYVKTNQPQALMHLESDSFLGRVLNPHNLSLSAGGSTGGESALIALRGSILGVGTDIGGSVRGPSGFCGIYGFKPTSCTLPMYDFLRGCGVAELNIMCSTGPMCRTLRDMDLFMRVVLAAKPYLNDPSIIPIPWTGLSTIAPARRLKIGIMWNDGSIRPQPPVSHALEWAQSRLLSPEHAGRFDVKPFTWPKSSQGMRLIRHAYFTDGGTDVKEMLAKGGEPMHPLTRSILDGALAEDVDQPTSVAAEVRTRRDDYRIMFAAHWNRADVDVVLSPVHVGPASLHDTAHYWNYTGKSLWNLVDYPGAVFPTPVVSKQTMAYSDEHPTPLSKADEHVRRLWEEGSYDGAPVNLQITGRRYHDNELFSALNVMKEALQLEGDCDRSRRG